MQCNAGDITADMRTRDSAAVGRANRMKNCADASRRHSTNDLGRRNLRMKQKFSAAGSGSALYCSEPQSSEHYYKNARSKYGNNRS